jgi:hypothetical protein
MVTERGKRAAGLLSSLLFLSFGWCIAEATTVRLTNGTLTGRSGIGTVDVTGRDFALSGNIEILDLIDVTDCIFCRPGQFYNPFWSFDLVYDGTLTWNGVTYTLDHQAAHGPMSGGGFFLPSQLGPAFSLDLPFTLSITLDGFDFDAVGSGVDPVVFSPDFTLGVWVGGGHTYHIVPEPSSGWLLLAGVLTLGGVGWVVRGPTGEKRPPTNRARRFGPGVNQSGQE